MPIEKAAPDDAGLIPPQDMLYDGSSSPEEFVLLGEAFCEHILIPRAGLAPAAAILDVGCGNGAVARALTRFLSPAGRYEGLEINPLSVAWLQDKYRPYTNFRFTHADVRNSLYNPSGRHTAGEYGLPFGDELFDVVLLKSVFTHMLPVEVRRYLKEISRVLRRGGRAVVTFFLLNAESRRFIEAGGGPVSMTFEYGKDSSCRVMDLQMPESAVAHDEHRIRQYYAEAGLTPIELTFGNWCGRPALIGLQDLIVALKE